MGPDHSENTNLLNYDESEVGCGDARSQKAENIDM